MLPTQEYLLDKTKKEVKAEVVENIIVELIGRTSSPYAEVSIDLFVKSELI